VRWSALMNDLGPGSQLQVSIGDDPRRVSSTSALDLHLTRDSDLGHYAPNMLRKLSAVVNMGKNSEKKNKLKVNLGKGGSVHMTEEERKYLGF
jgi:hypothetical protein